MVDWRVIEMFLNVRGNHVLTMIGFLYNLGSWSYRRVVTVVTISWWILVLLLAIGGFVFSEILIPLAVIVWLSSVMIAYWSKRRVTGGVKWSLNLVWQQLKDWRIGRQLRKEQKLKISKAVEYGLQ